MDKDLFQQYEKVHFSPEQVRMFASILEKDEVHRLILRYIGAMHGRGKQVSINDLIQNIRIERRVQVTEKKKRHYVVRDELIDRKTAERVVDKLSWMSLVYYELMTPYKMLFLTNRGAQVLAYLDSSKKKEEV